MPEHTLLIVDDESNVLKSLRRLLIDFDCNVLTAESGDEGLKIFNEHKIQIVMSDYRMPGMSGVEFLRKIKERSPDTIRIIISGYADAVAIVEAVNEGQVYKFITKPWNDQELLTTIMRAFDQYDLQELNAWLHAELQQRNQELQDLTKSLEEKVAQRTRDLEIRNKALTIAQNILNLLPIGVLGIDSEGMVVYMNDAINQYVSFSNLTIGCNAFEFVDTRFLNLMKSVMEKQSSDCAVFDEKDNTSIMCIPLPEQRGLITIFGYFDLCKYKIMKEKIKNGAKIANV